MTTTDIINLALNIGLGVVSLILSIFAIWLSLRFNDSSNAALDSVKELAREIKTIVQIGLSQQSDFSTKMLDSIIEQNRFGRPELMPEQSTSTLENMLHKSLENAEQSITLSVENKVRELISSGKTDSDSIEEGINEIRSNIQEYSGLIKDQSDVIESLRSYKALPAYYVLLAAIIKSGARSEKELANVETKYSIPTGWESGLDDLLEKGLIQGSASSFRISKGNLPILKDWLNANWKTISRLMEHYAKEKTAKPAPTSVGDKEREIANSLDF